MVVGRVEEAAGRIGEAVEDAVHQGARGREPALVEGRLVQRQQAVGEIGVVLEDAVADRPAVLPRAAERAVRRRAARRGSSSAARLAAAAVRRRRVGSTADSATAASARAAIARPFQAASALSSRAGCGRVARRSSSRLRASASAPARRPRQAVALGQLVVGDDPRQDRDPLPVAVVGHAVGRRERPAVVAEDLADLGGAPGEGQALDAVGVGVLAGGERAVVGRQLAEQVVERPGRDRRDSARRR